MKKSLLCIFALLQITALCASDRGFINSFSPAASSSQGQSKIGSFTPPASPVKIGKSSSFSPYAAISFVAPSPTGVAQVNSLLDSPFNRSSSSAKLNSIDNNQKAINEQSEVQDKRSDLNLLKFLVAQHKASISIRNKKYYAPRSYQDIARSRRYSTYNEDETGSDFEGDGKLGF